MVICFGAITNLANNDRPETATGQLRVSVENVHAFVLGGPRGPDGSPPTIFNGFRYPIGELRGPTASSDQHAYGPMAALRITRLVVTSAWDAPGSAAAGMVDVILKDEKRLFPAPNFS